jgi:predicted DNA-binding protein
MTYKDWAIPAITVIFAAGVTVAGFEATAEDTQELQERVGQLESKSGKQEVIDLKIEGVETRLDKMEDLMGKMVEIQQQQAINQAKICQATNADCD